ncbi:MAG TPA: diaminopimelate decarboxylase [Candidatus Paceibacterota bacterium]|nr:diaminopimelate decarboxylase [Candidatus Paceibacterota bacterium]
MMSQYFQRRLFPDLREIAEHYGTPFHIYDEWGIRQTCQKMSENLGQVSEYRNFFAVKALPNPSIMKIIFDEGFGFDCSSMPELTLARKIGARPGDVMFTSNNTSRTEYSWAQMQGGCILNLDDISFVAKVSVMPELICFRYNPGPLRDGNEIIGKPEEAKYGVCDHQIVEAYRLARERGAKSFGLHTMICSNQRDYRYMVETIKMTLEVVHRLKKELNIEVEFVNIGGGFGIPYKPTDETFDLVAFTLEAKKLFAEFQQYHGWRPKLYTECGRYVTGPHGVLVTKVINKMEKYRRYVGVDACMSSLMRPALYDAYHQIYVPGAEDQAKTEVVDVVGSLCENNDKLAKQRVLPITKENDLLVIANTGAHGIAMGFTYNGRLRPKELLLRSDCSVELIRREETAEDYFRTLSFGYNVFKPSARSADRKE